MEDVNKKFEEIYNIEKFSESLFQPEEVTKKFGVDGIAYCEYRAKMTCKEIYAKVGIVTGSNEGAKKAPVKTPNQQNIISATDDSSTSGVEIQDQEPVTGDIKNTPAQVDGNADLTIEHRTKKAVDFLQDYFKGCHGYGYIWLKNKQSRASLTLPFKVGVESEITSAVTRGLKLNVNDFYDCYFGVNVGSKPIGNGRQKKSTVNEQVALVADIDIANAAHHKGDIDKYPPNIDAAIDLLPIKPSFLISSGGGIHAYFKLELPLQVTNDNDRDIAANRGKSFLDVMRQRAGVYAKSIDGVHDLPRVLRLPYSFNCKDRENLKLCTILESSEIRFTTAQIDEIIAASKSENQTLKFGDNSKVDVKPSVNAVKPVITPAVKVQSVSSDELPPEYESARIHEMLYTIPPAALSDTDWLAVISACKNLGVDESVVDNWNMQDAARYNERENKVRYDSLKDTSFDIEVLAGKARDFGYSEGDFRRQWFKDNPQFDTRLIKAREYSRKAGREFISLDVFKVIKKQIADAELIAADFLDGINDFSTRAIFNYEVLYSVAIVKNSSDIIGVYEDFIQRCKKSKQINITSLNEYVKKFADNLTSIVDRIYSLENQARADFQVANAADAPQWIIPEGYASDETGLFKIVEKGKMRISYRPIYITSIYTRRSEDNKTYYLCDLETLDAQGKKLSIERVEIGEIADARKLTALSSRGLSVTSLTSGDLVRYLESFKYTNAEKLAPQKLLSKLGWFNDDTEYFVTPYDKRFKLDWDKLGYFARSLKQKGRFDTWKDTAREVMNYPVARTTLAACLATPLLKPLNVRTFSLYLMCDSKAGKSAVSRFGASAWGTQGIVKNLRATRNGIEGELAECTDFPAIFDEKQLAENMDMTGLSYLIGQGEGKGRMSKDATTKKRWRWRTIGILSGEEEITEDTKTQGAITRTLSIVATGSKIIPEDLAEKIYESINQHYGWAGQCFIDNLLKENFDNLREMYKLFTNLFRHSKKKLVDDYCRYLSLITVADVLMQKYFFDTSHEKAVESAIKNIYEIIKMIGSERELSDAEREWDIVSGWLAENRGLILNNPNIESRNKDGFPIVPRQDRIIGKYEDGNVFVIVKSFNDEMTRRGLNCSKVKRDLVRAGYIVPANDGRTSVTKMIDKEFKPVRVIQIKSPNWKDDADD